MIARMEEKEIKSNKPQEESENKEVVIEIKDLCKKYKMYPSKKDRLLEIILPNYEKHDTFTAMEGFNLTLKKGEILGILGRNGAGKSTLLKMITGVVNPTSGSIQIKGKISSLLELGTAFNPELTGYENIYQHGQIMGLTPEEVKAKEQEIIDFADIGEHLSQPVKTYSSGMFARLAFACAINVDPDILIVDEVLSVGDMAFQLKCFKKFEQFKEQGKTILFVTHNVADVIRNCNRSIIISAGNKIFDGDVKTGVDKYKKMIVGIEEDAIPKDNLEITQEDKEEEIPIDDAQVWKQSFMQNSDMLSYGNGKAEIIDYGIFDKKGNCQSAINNEEEYIVRMKVKFNEFIDEPIFALAVKDFKGLELGGCNTKAYKVLTGTYQKGDMVTVEFKQTFPLAPDRYTLSFGCTKFNDSGDLEVFDRKYDALFVEIISYRDCLGVIDLKSEINVIRSSDS